VQALLARGLGIADIPRLPSSVPHLLERFEQQRHACEIAAVINRDPALAVELVHLENSPVFRRSSQPVKSVEAAFARYAHPAGGLRHAAGLHHQTGVFPPVRPVVVATRPRLCACLQGVCVRFGGDGAVAFFTGLIHDVGKLVVLQRTLAAFCTEAPTAPLRPHVFQQLIEEFAARLTMEICGRWNIPPEVSEASRNSSMCLRRAYRRSAARCSWPMRSPRRTCFSPNRPWADLVSWNTCAVAASPG
jgi:hypothetical protein